MQLKRINNLAILIYLTTCIQSIYGSDEETRMRIYKATVASQAAYRDSNLESHRRRLSDQGYSVAGLRERNGVALTFGYNDRSNDILIALRGTVITEPDNLYADLGIVDAAVREHHGRVPTVEQTIAYVDDQIANNIRSYLGLRASVEIDGFPKHRRDLISRLQLLKRTHIAHTGSHELYHGFGGGALGLLGGGALGLMGATSFISPPLTLVGMLGGASIGIMLGASSGQEVAARKTECLIENGRNKLALTMDTMLTDARRVVNHYRKRSSNPGDITITIAGHSLGGAGALAIAKRLKEEFDNPVRAVTLNAPGGHQGLMEIWNAGSSLRRRHIYDSSVLEVDRVLRASCPIANFGGHHYPSSAYIWGAIRAENTISGWFNTIMPSHSLDRMARDVTMWAFPR